MGVLSTVAVMLVLGNALAAGSHCRTYNATSIWNCGNMPAATNPRTVSWTRGSGSYVNRAYLEVWRVANIRSQQTGCLNAVEVAELHASSSSSYSLPSVDYNSLYIAKVLWLDSSNNAHYLNNSECYFIPQRSSPPRPRVSISSRYLTARSVTLSLSLCTSSSSYGSLKYVARYSSITGQELIAETTGSTLTIEHLLPDERYTFTVTCTNTVGVSGSSFIVSETTKSEGTLQPRISSVVIDNSLAFADISWAAPSAVDLVSGYDVQVVPHVGGIPQSPSVYLMATSSRYNTSYRVIWSFTPETLYMFQVRARTSVGTSQWSTPFPANTLPAVPHEVNGFSLDSTLSTTISMYWNGSNATVDYYMLTIHSVEANVTEHYQLFHTVNSHTFHNLSSNTVYSVTITAVNKAGSGPTVSVNVTTQGPDAAAQPLAVTTGIFGTVAFIGVVGLLLIGGACFGGRYVLPKLRALSRRKDDDCQIEENVAYATAPGDRLWSQNFFFHKKEGVGSEEDQWGFEGGGQGIPELDYAPNIPSRVYLKEKEKGPTEFASVPVYIDEGSFHEESGWFVPAPADVITRKLGMDLAVFADLGPGVYFMCHKTKEQAKWVGLSPDLCRTLCGLFFQLYQKERSELSPLEVELKFFSPFAADWDIQVWSADPKGLVLEKAKKIVECKTLKPLGLNTSLTFTDKETWEEFTSWFQAKERKQK